MNLHPARRNRAPFLVVSHHESIARDLTVALGRHAPTSLATTLAEARYVAASHALFSGVVVELRMPDGSGLHLLSELQRRQPRLHGLVLTSLHDPTLFEGSRSTRTFFAPLRPDHRSLAAFLVACLDLDVPETRRPSAPPGTPSIPPTRPVYPAMEETDDEATDPHIDPATVPFMSRTAAVRDEAAAAGLTTREMQVLGLAVEGRERDEVTRTLGMDALAWEGHVRRILAKTGKTDLHELVRRILYDAKLRSTAVASRKTQV